MIILAGQRLRLLRPLNSGIGEIMRKANPKSRLGINPKAYRTLSVLGILAGSLASAGVDAAPFDGLSAATAGYSAAQILADGYATTNGVYWVDPDGAGGGSPFQIYADMTTNGGGWMLVRHIAGTGGWIPTVDNLQGTASIAGAPNPLAANHWTIAWTTLGITFDDFLFISGDQSAWGVLGKADVFEINESLTALNAVVKASFGVGVTAGNSTNVLNRVGLPEDPWIGFEGTHTQNYARMLYAEGGYPPTGLHELFKNQHQGSNVYVREANPIRTVSTPIPEPGSIFLLGSSMLALAGVRLTVNSRRIGGRHSPRWG